MNIYAAKPVKSIDSLSGNVFLPGDGNWAMIADYPWGGDYRPEARAKVEVMGDALAVTLCAREETIRARETRFGGAVCVDSCLEFFVNPCPAAGDAYVNVEVNPLGTMHMGAGPGRENRRVLPEMPEGICLSVSRHAGAWWAVRYALPFALLSSLTGHPCGRAMAVNFYCCDESVHPHFGVWNHVTAQNPDFHRPECFGRLEFA